MEAVALLCFIFFLLGTTWCFPDESMLGENLVVNGGFESVVGWRFQERSGEWDFKRQEEPFTEKDGSNVYLKLAGVRTNQMKYHAEAALQYISFDGIDSKDFLALSFRAKVVQRPSYSGRAQLDIRYEGSEFGTVSFEALGDSWSDQCAVIPNEGRKVTSAYLTMIVEGRGEVLFDNVHLSSHESGDSREFSDCQQFVDIVSTREVLPYFFKGTNTDSALMTLCTHLSLDRLASLTVMAESWHAQSEGLGSISASIFVRSLATADRLKTAIAASPALQQIVDMHVVVGDQEDRNCYPHNYLRNVAMRYSRSDYIMSVDVDLLPGATLFASLDVVKRGVVEGCRKCIFIVPFFYTLRHQEIPDTKKALVELDGKKNGIHFGMRGSSLKEWRDATDVYRIANRVKGFNPFFIQHRAYAPYFHPLFCGYGSDRVSYLIELEQAGFEYYVLPEAWVVHMPHTAGVRTINADQVDISVYLHQLYHRADISNDVWNNRNTILFPSSENDIEPNVAALDREAELLAAQAAKEGGGADSQGAHEAKESAGGGREEWGVGKPQHEQAPVTRTNEHDQGGHDQDAGSAGNQNAQRAEDGGGAVEAAEGGGGDKALVVPPAEPIEEVEKESSNAHSSVVGSSFKDLSRTVLRLHDHPSAADASLFDIAFSSTTYPSLDVAICVIDCAFIVVVVMMFHGYRARGTRIRKSQ
eukprot:Rmarinus@m.19060